MNKQQQQKTRHTNTHKIKLPLKHLFFFFRNFSSDHHWEHICAWFGLMGDNDGWWPTALIINFWCIAAEANHTDQYGHKITRARSLSHTQHTRRSFARCMRTNEENERENFYWPFSTSHAISSFVRKWPTCCNRIVQQQLRPWPQSGCNVVATNAYQNKANHNKCKNNTCVDSSGYVVGVHAMP